MTDLRLQRMMEFRVGEKGRVNLPAQLRDLAGIRPGDTLVVTYIGNGEVVVKTTAAIREFIHSGVVETKGETSVGESRREDVRASDAALERKAAAKSNPNAGAALLEALGL